MKNRILVKINKAFEDKLLLESTTENLKTWIEGDFLQDWALSTIEEFLDKGIYEELNDRFFTNLAFGTGGMRGKTMGKHTTALEMGKVSEQGTYEHPAVGSNNMNEFNVAKATLGLYKYSAEFCKANGIEKPLLVIAYDVRHFSEYFSNLSASIWKKMGGDVYIFEGARSTPQLSWTVRKMNATAGIVITASHNPQADNGYKVYFNDGAQITNENATGIVAKVKETSLKEASQYLDICLDGVGVVSKEIEHDYVLSINDAVIDKEVLNANKPKIVFSAIHGTGAVTCPDVMRHFGLDPILVEEQMTLDPRFPTVAQPNPEYAATMAMGSEYLKKYQAHCFVATDPDADRMGAVALTKEGELKLLTGNMIGSLLTAYRIKRMKALNIITNPDNCTIVKTYVTSPLQDAIAQKEGIMCVNVLTGFKWIGLKLLGFENKLLEAMPDYDYRNSPYLERAELLQKHSKFFVFGGEESYGYLGVDSLRDKDANQAVIMFSEMIAYLQSQGKSLVEFLDEVYIEYGYYLEDLKSIYYEGASGSQKIKNILSSLESNPIKELCSSKVAKAINFAKDDLIDANGDITPKEVFFLYELENGYKVAIRASGTEPKIKFYVFAKQDVVNAQALEGAKAEARQTLDKLLAEIDILAEERSQG